MPAGSLTTVDPDFASTATLRSDLCARRLQGEGISRFTVAARDRLPVEPGGLQPSPSGTASIEPASQRAQDGIRRHGRSRLARHRTALRDCVR